MMQDTIVDLQQDKNITTLITDHQARDLLQVCDKAMILANGKIIAQNSPSNLVNDIDAKNAYFGNSFKYN